MGFSDTEKLLQHAQREVEEGEQFFEFRLDYLPDPERGENIMAIIVPRPGVTLDRAALESHCEVHLGKQKRPRQIEIVSELPKNFLGKIQRRRLRESHDGKHTSEPATP